MLGIDNEISIIHKCGLYYIDSLRLTWSSPSFAGLPSISYDGFDNAVDDLTNFEIPLNETLFALHSDEMDWNWLRDALKMKLVELI